MVPIALGFIVYLLWRAPGRLRRIQRHDPRAAGLPVGSPWSGFLGFALNDSGIAVPGDDARRGERLPRLPRRAGRRGPAVRRRPAPPSLEATSRPRPEPVGEPARWRSRSSSVAAWWPPCCSSGPRAVLASPLCAGRTTAGTPAHRRRRACSCSPCWSSRRRGPTLAEFDLGEELERRRSCAPWSSSRASPSRCSGSSTTCSAPRERPRASGATSGAAARSADHRGLKLFGGGASPRPGRGARRGERPAAAGRRRAGRPGRQPRQPARPGAGPGRSRSALVAYVPLALVAGDGARRRWRWRRWSAPPSGCSAPTCASGSCSATPAPTLLGAVLGLAVVLEASRPGPHRPC